MGLWEETAGVLYAQDNGRSSIDPLRSYVAADFWRVESLVRGLGEATVLLVEDFELIERL